MPPWLIMYHFTPATYCRDQKSTTKVKSKNVRKSIIVHTVLAAIQQVQFLFKFIWFCWNEQEADHCSVRRKVASGTCTRPKGGHINRAEFSRGKDISIQNLGKHFFSFHPEVSKIIWVTLDDFSKMTYRNVLFGTLVVQSVNQFTSFSKEIIEK